MDHQMLACGINDLLAHLTQIGRRPGRRIAV